MRTINKKQRRSAETKNIRTSEQNRLEKIARQEAEANKDNRSYFQKGYDFAVENYNKYATKENMKEAAAEAGGLVFTWAVYSFLVKTEAKQFHDETMDRIHGEVKIPVAEDYLPAFVTNYAKDLPLKATGAIDQFKATTGLANEEQILKLYGKELTKKTIENTASLTMRCFKYLSEIWSQTEEQFYDGLEDAYEAYQNEKSNKEASFIDEQKGKFVHFKNEFKKIKEDTSELSTDESSEKDTEETLTPFVK